MPMDLIFLNDWTGVTSNHDINYTPTLNSGTAAAQALTSNETETRPVNISLNYFIKVN